jgi:hypothetical protein
VIVAQEESETVTREIPLKERHMARKGSVVKSEMGGAFPRPSMTAAKGIYDASPAPFNKPHSLGRGGIPTKFAETGPSKGPTPTQTSGITTRAARPGTKQFGYGRSDQ